MTDTDNRQHPHYRAARRVQRAQMALLEAWRKAEAPGSNARRWAARARPGLLETLETAEADYARHTESPGLEALPPHTRNRVQGGFRLDGEEIDRFERWVRRETDAEAVRATLSAHDTRRSITAAVHFRFPDRAFLDRAIELGLGYSLARNDALTPDELAHVAEGVARQLSGAVGQKASMHARALAELSQRDFTPMRTTLAQLLRARRSKESRKARDRIDEALAHWQEHLREPTLRWLATHQPTNRHRIYRPIRKALLQRKGLSERGWRVLLEALDDRHTGSAIRQRLATRIAERIDALHRHRFLRIWVLDEADAGTKLPAESWMAAVAAAPTAEAREHLADAMNRRPRATMEALEAWSDELDEVLTADLFQPALVSEDRIVRERAMRWMGRLRARQEGGRARCR